MAEPATPTPGGVFISYRRQETAPYARLLREQLSSHFDESQVFMDVDSIEVGVDFAEAIQQAVSACTVLLALIGPQWATIAAADGTRRLDDPDDLVRLEIEAGLVRDIRVIPVLVDGTPMPRLEQLPATLAPLVRRHALLLSYNRYAYDIELLLGVVERSLSRRSPMSTPDRVAELISQAWAASERNLYEEALRDLNRALELDPDNVAALVCRGNAYRRLGRREEALLVLDRALELDPDNEGALINRGDTYRMLERWEEALRDQNRVLELDPNDANALASRGSLYRSLDRHEEGLRDLNRSVELDPSDVHVLTQRGALFYDLKRFGEALRDLNRALELDPDMVEALACRAVTYRGLKRGNEAQRDLDRALELDPGNEVVLAVRKQMRRIW